MTFRQVVRFKKTNTSFNILHYYKFPILSSYFLFAPFLQVIFVLLISKLLVVFGSPMKHHRSHNGNYIVLIYMELMPVVNNNFWENLTAFPNFQGKRSAKESQNRVHIQVFRGPNNEEQEYAAWGFVVRQPADFPYTRWWH